MQFRSDTRGAYMGALLPGEAGSVAPSSHASRRVERAALIPAVYGQGGQAARLTAIAWIVGAAVNLLILFSPLVVPASRTPRLHLVLDTVDACVALLAAYMAHQRFRRGRRSEDLYLAQGLA